MLVDSAKEFVSVKLHCISKHVSEKDAIRRFAVPKESFDYTQITKMVTECFPHTSTTKYKLQYKDNEGDDIVVRFVCNA